VLLLLLVAIPGVGNRVNGSRRWLGPPGGGAVQVSELAKLGFVFFMAHYLALNQTRVGEFKRGFLIPLGIVGAFALLLAAEPDFGMAALYVAVGVAMLALAGAKKRYLVSAILVPVLALAALVATNENRRARLKKFWEETPYQIEQAQIAFAAGGVDGVGLGQGRQQLSYLPEAHTDMIFAVVGEELGLAFTLGVVGVYVVMLIAGYAHLRRAPNMFQFQLMAGCLLCIAIQTLVNLLSVTGVIPPKGMSLPFISAGLSNLLLMGLLLGVILNTQRTWGRAALPGGTGRLREVTA
jgi:cell division protein FtsW